MGQESTVPSSAVFPGRQADVRLNRYKNVSSGRCRCVRRIRDPEYHIMTNPFEDDDGTFLVLVNEEGQHSVWPVFADVPAGWTAACGEGSRAEALAFVEENWADMRPGSLVAEMGGLGDADRGLRGASP